MTCPQTTRCDNENRSGWFQNRLPSQVQCCLIPFFYIAIIWFVTLFIVAQISVAIFPRLHRCCLFLCHIFSLPNFPVALFELPFLPFKYMTFICPSLSGHSVHSSNIQMSCNIVDRPFRKPHWLLLNRLLSMKGLNIWSLINPSITLHGMLVELTKWQFDKSNLLPFCVLH